MIKFSCFRRCITFLSLFLSLVLSVPGVWATEGALVSSSPQVTHRRDDKVNKLMGTYIQQMIIQTVLGDTAEVVSLLIQRQKIELFPQIAYQAIEQITLQMFKLEETKTSLRECYDKAYEKTMDLMDAGTKAQAIQIQVRATIRDSIEPIMQKPVFRHIVTEVLKQSMQQNQKIIATHVMQRQAQLMMIQKQAQAMQKAIVGQYQQAVMQAEQRQRQMVGQQMQAVASQQQYSVLQQQYEQQLQALQKDVQLQYDKAVLSSVGGQ